MDCHSSSSSSGDASNQNSRSVEVKEKSKRPQLSCRNCRLRKVKCDRVQPCTACSLHQIAHECTYDLTEQERHPILQAEALRNKDKEIERLRNELAQRSCGQFIPDNPEMSGSNHCPPPHSLRGLPTVYQHCDGAYDDRETMMTRSISVTQELADMTLQSKDIVGRFAITAGSRHRGPTSYPFPTLWTADDGIAALYPMLPPRHELFAYLDSFEKRAVGVAFPYPPKHCTRKLVERFLANLEHHAEQRPDILALLFTAIAQGIFYGALDRQERPSLGAMSQEIQKGSVFMATAFQALRVSDFLSRPSLCTIEALSMLSQFLCDTGKFVDAWVMIGTTVRLAVLAKYHRNPVIAVVEGGQEDHSHKAALWWWLLSLDATSSMVCGRPLGASTPGDCRPLEPSGEEASTSTLTSIRHKVTALSRAIQDQRRFTAGTIQSFTEKLSSLLQASAAYFPPGFNWSHDTAPSAHWPVDAQLASLQILIYTLVILVNQQRQMPRSDVSDGDVVTSYNTVLEASRTILRIFAFVKFRIPPALQNWTLCQAAFNAAVLLTRGMGPSINFSPTDASLVGEACSIFSFIQQTGIHSLGGTAAAKLHQLFQDTQAGRCLQGDVLTKDGMSLIEGNDLQDTMLTGYDFTSGDSDMSSTHEEGSPHSLGRLYPTAAIGPPKDKSVAGNKSKTRPNQATPVVSTARPSTKRTPRKADEKSSHSKSSRSHAWPSGDSHGMAQGSRQWSVSKKQHSQTSGRHGHGAAPPKPRSRGTGAAASQYMSRELSGATHQNQNQNQMSGQYLPNDVLNAFPQPPSGQMAADVGGGWEELASQMMASNSHAQQGNGHGHGHFQIPLSVPISMNSQVAHQNPSSGMPANSNDDKGGVIGNNNIQPSHHQQASHSQAAAAASIAAQHVFTSSSHTYSQPQSPALWGFQFNPSLLEQGMGQGQGQGRGQDDGTYQGVNVNTHGMGQEQQILFPGGVTDPRYFWGLEDESSGTQHFWGG